MQEEIMSGAASYSGLVLIGIIVAVVVMGLLLLIKQYKICPNDKVLVVYGLGSGDKGLDSGENRGGAKVIRGGGTLVIPFLQSYKFMSLSPISIDVNLTDALSSNSIRLNVPAQFTLTIDSKKEANLRNAVRSLLDLTPEEIKNNAENIIFGSLRSVISQLTIEELTSDRERFISLVNKEVTVELNKIGLDVVNVNIKDITDDSGYIIAMGQKAAASAIQKAHVDVAEQERQGSIGVESATTEKEIAVAAQKTKAEIGKAEANRDQSIKVATLRAETVRGQNESKANEADSNAQLAVKETEALKISELARAKAEEEISFQQRSAEKARLEKEELPKAQIQKEQREIAAQADANETVIRAKGDADAVRAEYEAKADGEKALYLAKAEGYKRIVEAAGGDVQAANQLMITEQLPELTRIMAEAMKNIKIDQVMVWDSGNGEGSGGGVSNHIKDIMSALPQSHKLASMAGIELPEFLMGKNKEAEDMPVNADDIDMDQVDDLSDDSKTTEQA